MHIDSKGLCDLLNKLNMTTKSHQFISKEDTVWGAFKNQKHFHWHKYSSTKCKETKTRQFADTNGVAACFLFTRKGSKTKSPKISCPASADNSNHNFDIINSECILPLLRHPVHRLDLFRTWSATFLCSVLLYRNLLLLHLPLQSLTLESLLLLSRPYVRQILTVILP